MEQGKGNAKHWTLTLNNYREPCLGFNGDEMQYLICGLEIGEKGTKHIQGYVQFKKKKRFTAVQKLFPGAHLEVAKGNPEQNYKYCAKDGEFHEHGVIKGGSGTRTDLNAIKELVDSGSDRNVIRESNYNAYIRYNRQIIQDIEDRRTNRREPTSAYILMGETGVGKSRWCNATYPDAYWKTRGPWWDGYDGHETVIIDEFYGWLPFDFLLRLLDRYPLQVEVKGSHRKFVAKRVIFTTNTSWESWYPGVESSIFAALRRRITGVCELLRDAEVEFKSVNGED